MTMPPYLLGLGIGTQGTEGLLVTLDGEVRAEFYEPLTMIRNRPGRAAIDNGICAALGWEILAFLNIVL